MKLETAINDTYISLRRNYASLFPRQQERIRLYTLEIEKGSTRHLPITQIFLQTLQNRRRRINAYSPRRRSSRNDRHRGGTPQRTEGEQQRVLRLEQNNVGAR